MKNSCTLARTGMLATAALGIPAASALGGIEVEASTMTVRVIATSADPVGSGTPVDITHAAGSPGGDGSTFHSTSPAPAHPWSSTGRYLYSFYLNEDPFGFNTDFGGSGLAEAGVTGTPGLAGTASATAYSQTVLALSVGPGQLIHLAGTLTAHSSPGGGASSFAEIRIGSGSPGAGTLVWSAAASGGLTTFGLDLFLPAGGYVFRARADASAFGAHPGGPFPPGGGDASFDYSITLIPAPSSGLLMGALGLAALRRRRV